MPAAQQVVILTMASGRSSFRSPCLSAAASWTLEATISGAAGRKLCDGKFCRDCADVSRQRRGHARSGSLSLVRHRRWGIPLPRASLASGGALCAGESRRSRQEPCGSGLVPPRESSSVVRPLPPRVCTILCPAICMRRPRAGGASATRDVRIWTWLPWLLVVERRGTSPLAGEETPTVALPGAMVFA